MRKRKNGFWTFVFSFIPGCAEMYMGFMKMGLSLMVAFFGLWAPRGLAGIGYHGVCGDCSLVLQFLPRRETWRP